MKAIVASIVIAGAIIFAALIIVNKPANNANYTGQQSAGEVNNVSVENGKQIITLDVRGGYSPKITSAKAGVPTILRLVTNGTFDCSAALSIPVLGFRQNLPSSGTTEVEIPPQSSGSSISGICAMGMYNLKLNFN